MCKRQAPQLSCDSSVNLLENHVRSSFEGFGPQRKLRPSLTSSFFYQEVSSYLGTRSRGQFDALILAVLTHASATTVGDLPLRWT
jgi:hypothetical protein